MKRVITAMEARKNFGNILNEVSLKDDKYIINRAGKPIAAVVSIGELQRMEQDKDQARNQFSGWIKGVRVKFKDIKDIEKLVDDAVTWAKKKHKA